MNEINVLNKALKGEMMAIETFDHFIKDVEDDELKSLFQDMQKLHKLQSMEIAEHIQVLGGNPVNSAGMAGLMTELKYRVSPNKYIDEDIKKTMLEGEELGLEALKEIKSELNDFDNIDLIQRIIDETQTVYDEIKSI